MGTITTLALQPMGERLERLTSGALIAAAITIAAAVAYREFVVEAPAATVSGRVPPRFEKSWQELLSDAQVIGDPSAPVKIVEFSDFECPACRAFHQNVGEIMSTGTSGVAVFFIHFPLESHRFAAHAAKASECARAQGRFREFVGSVFAKQDSIGLKSWDSFAVDAGITDTATFAVCVVDPAPVARLQANIALGERFKVSATPTIFINGWRLDGSPPKQELSRIISAIKAGREPQ